MRKLDPARDILREYGGGQTVQGVVRLAQRVGLVLKLDDDANWPEDLLLDDAHVWLSVGIDRWLDPVALRSMSLASKAHLGALLLARINVTHDALRCFTVRKSKRGA